jgi:hypothetical protein
MQTTIIRPLRRRRRRGGEFCSSSPAFRGRGGTQAEGPGGEGPAESSVQTLASHRSAAGPSSPVRTGGAIGLAVAASLLLAAGPAEPRPEVMLMTGLPLVWGEKGPFDPGSRPQASYSALSGEFDFRPVDVLDGATLARGRFLFLAQPRRLAPAELVALDGWIRRGGRALILTDPHLTWPSELPPGDIRRPPPAGLLAPLLDHWRLALEPPTGAGQAAARWNGRPVLLDSPGRLRSSSPDCVVGEEDWTALCRLGHGMVRVVADADLMRDSASTSSVADNAAAVAGWLDEMAGISRPRPAGGTWIGAWLPVRAIVLLVVVASLLLLLRRTR